MSDDVRRVSMVYLPSECGWNTDGPVTANKIFPHHDGGYAIMLWEDYESLRAEVERWAEVKSYWAKVVGRMHSSAQHRGLYEQTPRNLAALLDHALEGGE